MQLSKSVSSLIQAAENNKEEKMKVIVADSYEQMSEYAMMMLLGEMMQDKKVNVVLTMGRSPKRLYELMVPYVKDNKMFDNVDYYFFDENPHTNRPYGLVYDDIYAKFLGPANIPAERIHYPTLEDYDTYDERIEKAGGIDICVAGFGADGHFAANVPYCTPMTGYTYTVPHAEKCAKNPTYKERPFEPITISMGPASFMKMKKLIMIVNGAEKAEGLKRLMTEPVNEGFPASVLKLHPNFTIICDSEAGALLEDM